MVGMARFFLDFTAKESCGKCVQCRIGTRRLLEILTRITNGEGKEGDVELLEELCVAVKDGALCGLGQTAPNPLLDHHPLFPQRVRRSYPGEALPRQGVRRSADLPDRCRQMQRLLRLYEKLPCGRHQRKAQGALYDRCRALHQMRPVRFDLPVRGHYHGVRSVRT